MEKKVVAIRNHLNLEYNNDFMHRSQYDFAVEHYYLDLVEQWYVRFFFCN